MGPSYWMPVQGEPDDELTELIDRLLGELARARVHVPRPTRARGSNPVFIKVTFRDEEMARNATVWWAIAKDGRCEPG